MKDRIILRNLFSTYEKANKGKRNEVYYNDHLNNLIVFEPYDKECDTDSICNGIGVEPYNYLIKVLNEKKNVVVHWTQVEGTTSDYDIFFNHNPIELKSLSHKDIIDLLFDSVANKAVRMKYRIVDKIGVMSSISREEMQAVHNKSVISKGLRN
jgi:hypothetical protein